MASSEIFNGITVDTNSIKLNLLLNTYGIFAEKKVVLKDNFNIISKALKNEIANFDFIFFIGGLGTTIDDITLDTVAKTLKIPIQIDSSQKEKIVSFLKVRGNFDQNLLDQNLKQARFIGNKIDNNIGYALGSYLEYEIKNKKKHIFLLPGPPDEFEFMLKNYVEKILNKYSNQKIYHKSLYFYNVSESFLNNFLKDLKIKTFYGIYAKYHLKIVLFESKSFELILDDLKKLVKNDTIIGYYIREIKERFQFKIKHKNFFETDKDIIITEPIDFSQIFFEFLKEKNIKFSSVESCSGGLLSQKFTFIPSSSNYFLGSIVCYSNFSKEKILKIKSTILKKGAVSEIVTKFLAKNCIKIFKSDFSISITGFAGPAAGIENYPIGTCFVGICFKKRKNILTKVFKLFLKGNRNTIQNLVVIFAMFLAIYILND